MHGLFVKLFCVIIIMFDTFNILVMNSDTKMTNFLHNLCLCEFRYYTITCVHLITWIIMKKTNHNYCVLNVCVITLWQVCGIPFQQSGACAHSNFIYWHYCVSFNCMCVIITIYHNYVHSNTKKLKCFITSNISTCSNNVVTD